MYYFKEAGAKFIIGFDRAVSNTNKYTVSIGRGATEHIGMNINYEFVQFDTATTREGARKLIGRYNGGK